jgi:hypothetical protein
MRSIHKPGLAAKPTTGGARRDRTWRREVWCMPGNARTRARPRYSVCLVGRERCLEYFLQSAYREIRKQPNKNTDSGERKYVDILG